MDPDFDPLASKPSNGQEKVTSDQDDLISALNYPSLDAFLPTLSPTARNDAYMGTNDLSMLQPVKSIDSSRTIQSTSETTPQNLSPQKPQKPVLVDRETLKPVQPPKGKGKGPFLVERPVEDIHRSLFGEDKEEENRSVSSAMPLAGEDKHKRMEDEFGRQRKKFMTQMIKMEQELTQAQMAVAKKEEKILNLKDDLVAKEREMEDTRAAAAISESLLKDSFQEEHKQMVDEINSLKQIVQVTAEEDRTALHQERTAWNAERQRLQNDIAYLQQQHPHQQHPHQQHPHQQHPHQQPNPTPGDAWYQSAQPTSYQQQQQQQHQQQQQRQQQQRQQQQQQQRQQQQQQQQQLAPRLAKAEELQKHMKKAQVESQRLREVVIPLEEEIAFLKAKLNRAEGRLKSLEGSTEVGQLIDLMSDDEHLPLLGEGVEGAPPVPPQSRPEGRGEEDEGGEGGSEGKQPSLEQTQQEAELAQKETLASPEKKGKPDKPRKSKLQKMLEKERSLKSDVEIRLDVMTTQRNVLQEDLRKAQAEINQLQEQLEKESQSKEDLKKTWELANFQFLELQQQYKTELEQLRMSSSLTSASLPSTTEGCEPLQFSTEDLLKEDLVASVPGGHDRLDGSSLSRDLEYLAMVPSPPEEHKSSFGSGSVSELDTLLSQLGSMRSQLARKEKTCTKLQSELKIVKLSLEEDLKEKETRLEELEGDVSNYQTALAQEQADRKGQERELMKMRDEIDTRVGTFEESVRTTRQQLDRGREEFVKLKKSTQEQIMRLSGDRKEVWDKVVSSREEYGCLKRQHLMEMEEQARRMSQTERTGTDRDQALELSEGATGKGKEKLIAEITHLRKQLLKEQEERREAVAKSESSISSSSDTIGLWKKKCDKLESESQMRQEASVSSSTSLSKERETWQSILQDKNRRIQQLKDQIESLQNLTRAKKVVTQ